MMDRRVVSYRASIIGAEERDETERVYRIEVKCDQDGVEPWFVDRRYNDFSQLYELITKKFPDYPLPEFPSKTIVKSFSYTTIETRKLQLNLFLNAICASMSISQVEEVLQFLDAKIRLNNKNSGAPLKTILMPLPDKDFDPTETAVPWRILVSEGYKVVFATEHGLPAQGDNMLLNPTGIILKKLAAELEPRQFYAEMAASKEFQHPIRWSDIKADDYDGMILPGGHAPGMKQYLESEVLREKIYHYWQTKKPLGAICHGVLALARTRDPLSGQSVLFTRKTTTLPKIMENTAYVMTMWSYGKLYRTYETHTADEVKSLLANPDFQFAEGPLTLGSRGSMYNDEPAFVFEDGNYLSARWPGDSYLFGKKFVQLLKSYQPAEEQEAPTTSAFTDLS